MTARLPTNLGIMLRKKRVERGERLYDMAKAMDVSSAFLSGIETGKKRAPDDLVERLADYLQLDMLDRVELKRLAEETGPEVRIPLEGKDNDARYVAAAFAREFEDNLDVLKKFLKELESKREGRKDEPTGN